ncbi:spore germination protein KB [Bacillus mesophilus]|uniref:Endospore germination permease n=1 Tax=Bacillus mesophilus TaxID=1808955 RepID=A0A6M0Q5I8_9BACI|nr:endospore germination permease [Bacillus mesophilus]MBM7659871.1 spore germination protein KB [Bacillus mesophilus]NEY70730.1 endospore germination permease [Bacillus mesophilus]
MNNETVYISPRQFSILTSLFVVGSAVLFIPTILVGAAKQDAWISGLLGILFGILLAWFYGNLSKIDPDKSYIQLCMFSFGKWGGGLIAILTFTFHIILSCLLLFDIGDFLLTHILIGTPIEVIYYMFILAVVVYSTRLGIEPIARSAEIFFPWLFMLFILISLFLLPQIQGINILPVFEDGILPILNGTYFFIGFPFVEMILLLMITPHIYDKTKITSSFINGVVLGSFILFVLVVMCILVLGPGFSMRNEFPIYVLGKKVSIGNFLERVEVIIAIIWFLSIYFKLTIVSYSFLVGLSQLLNMKDYRPLTFPFAVLIIPLTLLVIPSSIYLKEFSKHATTPYMIFIGFILPLLVYMVSKWKKKNETS